MAAYQLARKGWKVLLVEKGERRIHDDTMRPVAAGLDRSTYDINGRRKRLTTGKGFGGGTEVYGAVLMRPHKVDFSPGHHYHDFLDPQEWDWPVSFDEMLPYYKEVEQLFGVSPFVAANDLSVSSWAPFNRCLYRAWKDHGVQSGQLPLAIQQGKCLQCADCPGFICPSQARGGVRQLLQHAVTFHDLTVWTECEAIRFSTSDHCVTVRDIRKGTRHNLKASILIVSLGALHSPAFFQRSGWQGSNDLLGRRYMYHAGGLVAGFFGNRTDAGQRFVKQLGIDQFYFGESKGPKQKWGVLQSLPTPNFVPTFVRNHTYLMMATVEDLPQSSNRVTLDRQGNPRLQHRFHPFDIQRSKAVVRVMKRLMHMAGAVFSIGVTADHNQTHVGHQVGTMSFGNDPKVSVLDRYCRPHGLEKVFVLDGSFMPTSLGVGPALTIMANALRVTNWISQSVTK